MAYQAAVLEAIKRERRRQDQKWGEGRQMPPERWFAILAEEQGEVAREVVEAPYQDPAMTRIRLKAELTQVAAVAVAWLESLNDG